MGDFLGLLAMELVVVSALGELYFLFLLAYVITVFWTGSLNSLAGGAGSFTGTFSTLSFRSALFWPVLARETLAEKSPWFFGTSLLCWGRLGLKRSLLWGRPNWGSNWSLRGCCCLVWPLLATWLTCWAERPTILAWPLPCFTLA